MSELPMGWVWSQLGDLVEFAIGGDWGKDLDHNEDGFVEVRCIRGTELRSWNAELGRSAVARRIKEASLDRRSLTENDLIVEISGGGPDQPVGRTVRIVDTTLDQHAPTPVVCTNFFRKVRLTLPDTAPFVERFLGFDYSNGGTKGIQSGSNNLRNLNFTSFLTKQLPLAPLAEQERIVRKLDTLSARTTTARTHLTAIAKLVETYKAAVLAAAFSSKENEVSLGSLLDGIKAGKSLKCDERPPQEGERGTVKVSAVTWGEFRPDQSKTFLADFEPDPDTIIRAGDFLFSRANTIELVGAVVIVDETPGNLFLSDKVLRLDMADSLKPWVLWFLRSHNGRKQLQEVSSGNQMSMRNIGQAKLKSLVLPLPDESRQQEIIDAIEATFAKIDRLAAEVEKALKLTERLDQRSLAKAFAGELVPQDPNDEPASVLLDRIREARANAPKKMRPRRTKATTMKKDPRDLLLADSVKWPENGVTPEELAKRVAMPHSDLRDALFELLGGTKPQVEQVFDKTEERMRLKRVAQ